MRESNDDMCGKFPLSGGRAVGNGLQGYMIIKKKKKTNKTLGRRRNSSSRGNKLVTESGGERMEVQLSKFVWWCAKRML